MRKLAILLAFLIFLVLPSAGEESNSLQKLFNDPPLKSPKEKPGQTFKSVCEECQLEVNIETEIKRLLDIEPVYVSLDECIDVAIENNFNLASYSNIYSQRKYEYRDALSKFLPNAGLNFTLIQNDGQVLVGGLLVQNFHETALSYSGMISHDLTDGGRFIFMAKSANQLKKASHHDLKFTRAEVLLHTSLNYYRALQSKLEIEIYIKNYAERLAQLKLVEVQEAAGVGTKFDIIRAENEKLDAEQSLLRAARSFRLNQASLANVMGIDISVPITPVETEVQLMDLLESKYGVEELYELALDYREDLKSVRSQIRSMQNLKTAIYTEFIPRAQVSYQFAWQGTASAGLGTHSLTKVNLDIPIGERLGVSTVNRARAQAEQIKSTENQLRQRLQDIKENIVSSYYNSKISKEKSEIIKKQIDYASESVRLAELRQQAGEGILIDVIQAQTIKTDARLQYIMAVIEYNVSQIQLLFDSGVISPANILKDYSP